MIIWIAQFESCSVHTREVIAIFELRSVHTRDRICDLAFQSGRTCVPRVWVPCPSVHMQHALYKRKWLEGHVALPPKSQFRGQGIHTAILLRDLRDAKLENTSGPSFELRISNYALRCNFAYTRSKNTVIRMIIQNLHLEWSFKLRTLLSCENSQILMKPKHTTF